MGQELDCGTAADNLRIALAGRFGELPRFEVEDAAPARKRVAGSQAIRPDRYACQILPGVTIGDGSIVAASAVVMTNVAPNLIVSGPQGASS
jgi:hypothetical protein